MTIAIDFDQTLFTGTPWPQAGEPYPGAIDAVRRLYKDGHTLILFTLRRGRPLRIAKRTLAFYGVLNCFSKVNKNVFNPAFPGYARGIAADIYIDDRALGFDAYISWKISGPDWRKIEGAVRRDSNTPCPRCGGLYENDLIEPGRCGLVCNQCCSETLFCRDCPHPLKVTE